MKSRKNNNKNSQEIHNFKTNNKNNKSKMTMNKA